ncbi:hypothetical protein [Mycolicibacterium frederiksbergense]|uniref:Uncharacterized protein n=1 Tax=Mycolicibacterium frederiksbergense TaxID=117567 RepID=A0A6H0RX22_9MYCO|nr:hypothetical protein [Mycolicibacterium frederiksbergense]QIV79668.1 hypothetical protein EXE63_01110 [Mycolicibacterium frederiksbergense]
MSDSHTAGSSNEGAFMMDPDSTLRELARHLVEGQQTIATLTRTAAKVRATASPDNAPAKELLAAFDDTTHRWLTEELPALVASMQLALEVHDTFGPGMASIDDPIEAAIWNNKWFVAEHELSGRPRGTSSSSSSSSPPEDGR